VALSSTWVEYMSTRLVCCEAIWLCKILTGLFGLEMGPMVIRHDNQSCIKLLKNLVFHDMSKHIEIVYHFIRDRVQRGAVRLQYISTEEQISNILTKPLLKGKFVFLQGQAGGGGKSLPC
jgi:hypothetical protein